jgi:hypothetical protein
VLDEKILGELDESITEDINESQGGEVTPPVRRSAVVASAFLLVFLIGLGTGLYYVMKVDEQPLSRVQIDPVPETFSPTTLSPTKGPTFSPTSSPSLLITENPTESPTVSPPTESPTVSPPTESPTSSRPTESPTTSSPTESPTVLPTTSSPTEQPSKNPTVSPTENGETASPTAGPTESPTPHPTLPPTFEPSTKSRLNCSEITSTVAALGGNFGDNNFKLQEFDNVTYCGDTFGPDPERPNRNPWSVRIGRRDCVMFTYEEGIDVCDSVGARWCTVKEFEFGVAHGTGCGGDSEMVYTSTDCEDQDNGNAPGKVMFDVGLRATRMPFYECVSDLTKLSLARCCGDFEL